MCENCTQCTCTLWIWVVAGCFFLSFRVSVHYCVIRHKCSSQSFPVSESKTCCPNHPIDRTNQCSENSERRVCRLNENPTFPAITIVLKWFGMKTRFIAVGFFLPSFRRIRFWFIHAHIAVHILEFHRHLKVIRFIFRLNMIFHYERERFRNDYQLLQSKPSFNV